MERALITFDNLVSPEQMRMQSLIDKHGGAEVVMSNDIALREILEAFHDYSKNHEGIRSSSTAPGSVAMQRNRKLLAAVEALRSELSRDTKFVLAKNVEAFYRKFEFRMRRAADDVKVGRRAIGRMITPAMASPHDKHLDPDMDAIWEDMVSSSS